MVLRAGALPQSFLSACLNCSGRTLLSLRELRALKIDCRGLTIALLEAGQLEGDGTGLLREHFT